MPNDKINYAITKAAGEGSADNYEEIYYEGYGPSGVAIIVETLTDNRNRTAGDVRHAFDKHGGNMGANGCVSWMFKKKGVIVIDREETEADEDTIMMQALELGADDAEATDETFEITTEPETFSEVREGLEKLGYTFAVAEIQMVPDTYSNIDEEAGVKLQKMLDMFEDNDDVQNVYHNAEGL
jgi:YebC/PmpR family DNA-binding regulatory protein